MANIAVRQFKGYSSKPDFFTRNWAVAKQAENCIINKGDLCNIALFQTKYTYTGGAEFDLTSEKRITFYYNESARFMVIYSAQGRIKTYNGWPADSVPTIKTIESTIIFNALNIAQVSGVHGQVVQVGEWLFFLSRFDTYVNDIIDNPSRMPKLKLYNVTPTTNALLYYPIGLRSPRSIQATGTFQSFIGFPAFMPGTSTCQIAVTFHTDLLGGTDSDYDTATGLVTHIRSLDDIESNGVILDAPISGNPLLPNSRPIIKVYIPNNYNTTFVNTPCKLAFYAKLQDQSNYYFIGFSSRIDGLSLLTDSGGTYFEIAVQTFSPTTTQDLNIPLPVTGENGPIIGAHDLPKAAFHGTFFKGRMYYLTAPNPTYDPTVGLFKLTVKNRVQYSARTPIGEDETGRYANYIEGEEFIGNADEQCTGSIEFLNQLVIFKENSVWVITDDIADGEIRPLFEDHLGCVNKYGGKSYIVIDDILYWMSNKGVYSYDGLSKPKRISELIQEDIDAIDDTRLSFSRFNYDPQYNLLYIVFPKGYIGDNSQTINAFLYHTNELVEVPNVGNIGSWTRFTDTPSDIIVGRFEEFLLGGITARKWEIYYGFINKIYLTVDSIQGSMGIADDYAFFWESGILMFDEFSKKEHYKRFVLNAKGQMFTSAVGAWPALTVTFIDALDFDESSKVLNLIASNRCPISRKLPGIRIRLSSPDIANGFRINSFKIEGHPIGRH